MSADPLGGVKKMAAGSIALLLSTVTTLACYAQHPGTAPAETVEISRAVSPEGWCIASVVEFDLGANGGNTQVLLAFDGGRCGAGAVSADGLGLGLELRWLDAMTLEVRHPRGVALTRNASGEVIQCYNRKVRVLLVSA